MKTTIDKEKDFFISYTSKDENWATWIAETMESKGYSTIIQAWDFQAGGSFVNDMHQAIKMCKKIILVLSEKYLKSDYCTSEWQNFFVDDPVGRDALIIPVLIEDIEPEGLLRARTYIDLHGITESAEAAKRLLENVDTGFRPRISLGFPGLRASFPGELPFNNLPNRNIYFTGRENVLDTIESSFIQNNGVFSISGLGGIGKTQIAIEYAYRYSGLYNSIWLINAETDDSLFSDLLKFAEIKCGLEAATATPDIVIETVRRWTAHNRDWLFIFDNAEEYSTLKKYLPQNNAGQGKVIITSRNEFWDKTGSKALEVNIFSEAEAVQFLRNRTQIKNHDETAKVLNNVLGALPLALEHGAAYISENDITFKKYIELFDKYKTELLEQGLSKNEISVAATWQVSINKINIEAARQLLYMCSYYASENINLDTLILSNEYLVEPLGAVVADELEINNIVKELRRYSLVSMSNRNLSIHRLLQESVMHNIGPVTEYLECCFTHINKLMNGNNYRTKEGRDTARLLLPHAFAVFNYIESSGVQQDETHNLCSKIAYGLSEFALYTESIKFYHKAISIREKVLGKEHPKTAATYNNIASVYSRQGDYPKALEWHQKAFAIHKKVLDKDHPDIATTYNNIAVVYDRQGDYPKALEWYKKALAIREKVLGKEHPDTATTYNSIAVVYSRQGDYPKALEWYKKALAISEKVLWKEHPDTATTYNNIAFVYSSQGDYSKALECYQKALVIREKVLGKEHPDTATTYNNTAYMYSSQGDYPKALEWYQKALTICEKVLGKEHPDTATTYNNIAFVYSSQGDHPKALEWYQKSLAISEKVLGKEHPCIATTYNNIAGVFDNQGDYPKALEWYQKALAISERCLARSIHTATTYNNIACIYDSQRDYPKALEWYQKALTIFECKLGSEHPNTKIVRKNIETLGQ